MKAEIKIQSKIETINLNITQDKEDNGEQGELGTIREEVSFLKDKVNNNMKVQNKLQIMSHYQPNKDSKVTLNDIPNDVFIKNVLFFLDIQSLPKFAFLSKKTHECLKTHMIIRVSFLHKEKQMIEKANEVIIKEIDLKRKEFFEEYEIVAPSKESAVEKIKSLNSSVSCLNLY